MGGSSTRFHETPTAAMTQRMISTGTYTISVCAFISSTTARIVFQKASTVQPTRNNHRRVMNPPGRFSVALAAACVIAETTDGQSSACARRRRRRTRVATSAAATAIPTATSVTVTQDVPVDDESAGCDCPSPGTTTGS